MADIVLAASPRTELGSRPAGRIRRQGEVPAVVYGLGSDTLAVTVPSRELGHILAGEAGANTLITLRLDGDDILTFARQIQRDPTRGDLVHVDFVRIRRDIAIQAEVPVHLVGESEAVRDEGVVEQTLFSLTVEAKPEEIPPVLEVDISALAIGDQVLVGQLPLPPGVVAKHEPEELVVQVVVSRVAQDLEALEAEAAEAAEEGEAPEAAAAEEGEAPPEGEPPATAEGAGESGETRSE